MATKVLIGEDEALVAMDLEMALTQMGYLVVGIGSSGSRIIQLFKEHVPDLVLLDLRLQGPLDGFQTAAEIQKENRVPILFITAESRAAMPMKPPDSAIYDFLSKPFSSEKLEEVLRSLLKRIKTKRGNQSTDGSKKAKKRIRPE